MATWRDSLYRPTGVYGGVEFIVDSREVIGGRRGRAHEAPQRDVPLTEDLGRRALMIRYAASVIGDDYAERRSRLFQRCNSVGPGHPRRAGRTLVDPYLGPVEMLCTECKVTESRAEGRIARFSLTFLEAGIESRPVGQRNGVDLADVAAAAAEDDAEAAAVATIDTAGPASVQQDLAGKLKAIGSQIADLDVFSGIADDVAELAQAATDVADQASALATAPANLVSSVRSSIASVFSAAKNAVASLSAYESLFGFSNGLDGGTSPTAVQTDANTKALDELVGVLALAGAVRSAARVDWDSLDDALEARQRLAAKAEELLLAGGADSNVPRIGELRRVLSAAVPDPEVDLPSLLSLELAVEVPAVVLAYRLYDDVSREGEILRRNAVSHPGFVPAGDTIQVLSATPV